MTFFFFIFSFLFPVTFASPLPTEAGSTLHWTKHEHSSGTVAETIVNETENISSVSTAVLHPPMVAANGTD